MTGLKSIWCDLKARRSSDFWWMSNIVICDCRLPNIHSWCCIPHLYNAMIKDGIFNFNGFQSRPIRGWTDMTKASVAGAPLCWHCKCIIEWLLPFHLSVTSHSAVSSLNESHLCLSKKSINESLARGVLSVETEEKVQVSGAMASNEFYKLPAITFANVSW